MVNEYLLVLSLSHSLNHIMSEPLEVHMAEDEWWVEPRSEDLPKGSRPGQRLSTGCLLQKGKNWRGDPIRQSSVRPRTAETAIKGTGEDE